MTPLYSVLLYSVLETGMFWLVCVCGPRSSHGDLSWYRIPENWAGLGPEGWIVVGLRDLGRCGRWCASTMFLEYILSHPYPSSVVLMLC